MSEISPMEQVENADVPLTDAELDELERRLVNNEPHLATHTRVWTYHAIRQLRAALLSGGARPAPQEATASALGEALESVRGRLISIRECGNRSQAPCHTCDGQIFRMLQDIDAALAVAPAPPAEEP